MTVCKYLNLEEGFRGEAKKSREIEGVTSQHSFHQAEPNELESPDSMRLQSDMTHTHA
jgi:hypothetical protein